MRPLVPPDRARLSAVYLGAGFPPARGRAVGLGCRFRGDDPFFPEIPKGYAQDERWLSRPWRGDHGCMGGSSLWCTGTYRMAGAIPARLCYNRDDSGSSITHGLRAVNGLERILRIFLSFSQKADAWMNWPCSMGHWSIMVSRRRRPWQGPAVRGW